MNTPFQVNETVCPNAPVKECRRSLRLTHNIKPKRLLFGEEFQTPSKSIICAQPNTPTRVSRAPQLRPMESSVRRRLFDDAPKTPLQIRKTPVCPNAPIKGKSTNNTIINVPFPDLEKVLRLISKKE